MAKFVIFVVAALAFQGALAAPPKKTQTQGGAPAKNQIEEISKQVQNIVDEVSASLKKNLPDNKQITKFLTEQSNQLVENLQDIVKKLQSEIDKNKGSADKVLKQVTEKLTENIDALKQAVGPDAAAKANQIKTELDNHFKNSAAEFEKLTKIVQPNLEQAGETINTFAKGILDDFLKAAENLKTQVNSAVHSTQKGAKN